MPNPDGTETYEEAQRRKAAGAAGTVRNVLVRSEAVDPVPNVLVRSGAVDPVQAAYVTSNSDTGFQRGGGAGKIMDRATGPESIQGGVGTGAANGKATGIIHQGTIDPTTGLAAGGVVKAATDEYDYPTIYANQASGLLQAPAVTGAAPVQAAGNAIVSALQSPTTLTNNYIGQGAHDAGVQGALALKAAQNIGSVGQPNAAVQSGLVSAAPMQQAGARDAQGNLIGMLTSAAAGNGPSAAQPLLQQATDRIAANQAAASAGARGGSTVAAMRNAGQAGVDATLQANSQAAALRAQEQQQAQALLGSTTAQSRQGDTVLTSVLGGIVGQARGQDVDTAKATADAIEGVRQGTISAASVAATATNAMQATQGQIQQWAVQNGLDYGKLLQAAQAGDQGAALQLTQIMAQYSATLKGQNIQKNIAHANRVVGAISGIAGGATNGAGGAVIKAVM